MKPASLSLRGSIVLAIALATSIVYATCFYSRARTLSYFEFLTDGGAPDFATRESQRVLGALWTDGFQRGLIGSSRDSIVDAVADYVCNESYDGARGSEAYRTKVLELAAGNGVAPAHWASLLAHVHGLDIDLVLTDLQPAVELWRELPNLSFVPHSVDATNASAEVHLALPEWGADSRSVELRMIHLALHHFPPALAKGLIADAVRSGSALMIGDLNPCPGGLLFNGLLAAKYFLRTLPDILGRHPALYPLLLVLPAFIFGAVHDGTVSVLRSYSAAELAVMLAEVDGGDAFEARTYYSASVAQWLGVPSLFPVLDDPLLQFVLISPRKSPGQSRAEKQAVLPVAAGVLPVEHNSSKLSKTNEDSELESLAGALYALQLSMLAAAALAGTWTLSTQKRTTARRLARREATANGTGKPAILAIGTADPPRVFDQQMMQTDLDALLERKLVSAESHAFVSKCVATSGCALRGVCSEPGVFARLASATVEERHAIWAEWAPRLSIEAASKALNEWGGCSDNVTHVVFHSCTGFKAPGVELDLVDALKLKGVKRRLGINYMGCFGGFTGMSVAKAFVEADPQAVVLLVCCELCHLHYSFSENRSEHIGNAVFADGCAAAIIGAGRAGDWAIGEQKTHTCPPSSRGEMTWAPSNANYNMFLDKNIPVSLAKNLFFSVHDYVRAVCHSEADEVEWCVHPGGRGILDGLTNPKYMLGVTKEQLRHSYGVLYDHGNMSSCTIFFVIKRMQEEQYQAAADCANLKNSAFCLGFGPGLTIEVAGLHKIGSLD